MRTNEQLTQTEIDAFQKFCNDHRIVSDEGEVGLANGTLIGEYLINTWEVDLTPETLKVALEKLRDRLTFYSEAQAKYKQVAQEDPERANALLHWLQGPGNTSLVKEGEEALQNQSTLLVELRGREITPKNIQDAIGRAAHKRGLYFTQTPRHVDPRQHTDDGKGFLHDEKNPRYRNGKLNHAHVEPGTKQETMSSLDPSEARWQEMAEALRGNTHGKNAELERIRGKNWRETYELRKKALNANPVIVTKMGVA
jgi:hypothetical protein